jgi:hypothetical protein
VYDAYIVPSQGLSGGLWLLWDQDVDVSVELSNTNLIIAYCTIVNSSAKYGDPHHQNTSSIWATLQAFVVKYPSLPMLCMGDLNNIVSPSEKLGPRPPNLNRIAKFCCMVKYCGLFDLGYNGPAYTWTNKRFSTYSTFERLERCLANAEWCTTYSTTAVYHLPMMRSEHAPILTMLQSNQARINKPFRFENFWLQEQDFKQVAKTSWDRSQHRSFHRKLQYLAQDLKARRRTKPKINVQLQEIENQLLHHQALPPQLKNHSAQNELSFQHHNILALIKTLNFP